MAGVRGAKLLMLMAMVLLLAGGAWAVRFDIDSWKEIASPEANLANHQGSIDSLDQFVTQIPILISAMRAAMGNTHSEAVYQHTLEVLLLARGVAVAHESVVNLMMSGMKIGHK